jgi:hypothetical protein
VYPVLIDGWSSPSGTRRAPGNVDGLEVEAIARNKKNKPTDESIFDSSLLSVDYNLYEVPMGERFKWLGNSSATFANLSRLENMLCGVLWIGHSIHQLGKQLKEQDQNTSMDSEW